jgi:CheY-like chemotaxis protein
LSLPGALGATRDFLFHCSLNVLNIHLGPLLKEKSRLTLNYLARANLRGMSVARILIVDTDQMLTANVKDYLRFSGHETECCYDLQYAIDCADSACPDLVVLELLLCGRSGVEFLYEFRSYPDWQNIPVVIFTNVTSRDLGRSMAGFRQLNISAYHHKSTTALSQLTRTIDFLLGAPATV